MNKQPLSPSNLFENRKLAILSYLSFLCVIPLIAHKENPFVLAHAKQGLVLFVGEVLVFIIQNIIGGWFLILGLAIFAILSGLGIYCVIKGRNLNCPLVTNWAEHLTI